jgi:hypothetical protein
VIKGSPDNGVAAHADFDAWSDTFVRLYKQSKHADHPLPDGVTGVIAARTWSRCSYVCGWRRSSVSTREPSTSTSGLHEARCRERRHPSGSCATDCVPAWSGTLHRIIGPRDCPLVR